MDAPSPSLAGPMNAQQQAHLRMLSIFHYVVAGLIGLFSLLSLLYIGLGIGIVTGALPAEAADGSAADTAFGWIFVALGAAFLVGGLALAGVIAYAGRCLAQHRRHTFCLVVAALSCTVMPVGTVLGVFTLVTLFKPGVKEAFDAASTHA